MLGAQLATQLDGTLRVHLRKIQVSASESDFAT